MYSDAYSEDTRYTHTHRLPRLSLYKGYALITLRYAPMRFSGFARGRIQNGGRSQKSRQRRVSGGAPSLTSREKILYFTLSLLRTFTYSFERTYVYITMCFRADDWTVFLPRARQIRAKSQSITDLVLFISSSYTEDWFLLNRTSNSLLTMFSTRFSPSVTILLAQYLAAWKPKETRASPTLFSLRELVETTEQKFI